MLEVFSKPYVNKLFMGRDVVRVFALLACLIGLLACSGNGNINSQRRSNYTAEQLANEWRAKIEKSRMPVDNDSDYYYPRAVAPTTPVYPPGNYYYQPYSPYGAPPAPLRGVPAPHSPYPVDNDSDYTQYPKYNSYDDNALVPYQPQVPAVEDNDEEYNYPLYFDE